MSERPPAFDHLRSAKKPATRKVSLCLDPDLGGEYEEAIVAADSARDALKNDPDAKQLPELRRAVEDADALVAELREQVEPVTQVFTFRSMGRKKFENLMLEHPATQPQKDAAVARNEGEPQWNEDTFPQALVAGSLADPPLTFDQVKILFDDDEWSGPELLTLWTTALAVNQSRRVLDLGKGSGTTLS